MAHLDNLIESIQDPALRTALQTEVRKVLNNRQFGLVFNPHKPESILLPGFKVRRGDKVKVLEEGTNDRTDVDDTGVWVVLKIGDGVAHLRAKSEPELTREAAYDRLVVVREFGDPIFPGLTSTDRIERAPEKPWHALINGENFHALQALLYPYEGKIDAIYIDPPYNTRDKDWKYNNDYVDTTDPYKHSKWLSMMERRLRLAKRLLNPRDSVLIVTIDEKEYLRLGLLLEQTFSGALIQMTSIVINGQGSARKRQMSRVDEYIFTVYIGEASVIPSAIETLQSDDAQSQTGSERIWFPLIRGGKDGIREKSWRSFFPIFIDDSTGKIVDVGEPLPLGTSPSTVTAPAGQSVLLPISKKGVEGRWQMSKPEFLQRLRDGYIRVGDRDSSGRWPITYIRSGLASRIQHGELEVKGRDHNGALIVENSTEVARTKVPKTVWYLKSHNAGTYGTALLDDLVPGRPFPFPKSLYAVEDTLRFFVANKPRAVVLDFFAGSGTTSHAVARLNRQDNGQRQSIVVTNNEVSPAEAESLRAQGHNPGEPEWERHGICEYITQPRLRAAFTGVREDGKPVEGDYKFTDEFPMSQGFEENVEFFNLTYEDPALISLGRRFSAIAPLLWLKAGGRGTRIDEIDPSGWAVPEDGVYGVLFDTVCWSDFVSAANARHDSGAPLAHAFIVTDSHSEFQQIVSRLDPSLPTTRLYADYLRTFEINTIDD